MTERSNLLLKKPQPEFQRKKGGDAEDDDEVIMEEEDEEEEEEEELDIQENNDMDSQTGVTVSKPVKIPSLPTQKYIESIDLEPGVATIRLKLPLNSKKILMTK